MRETSDKVIMEIDELNGEKTDIIKQSGDEIKFRGVDELFTPEME